MIGFIKVTEKCTNDKVVLNVDRIDYVYEDAETNEVVILLNVLNSKKRQIFITVTDTLYDVNLKIAEAVVRI